VYAGQAAQYRRQAGTTTELVNPPAPGSAEFARWMEAACSAPLRQGNRVAVLRNGDEIIAGMLDALGSAVETVDFCNYIFWKGETATSFAEALSERARAGVAVNVLLDAYGSAKIERGLIPEMERAGVNFSWFRSPHWYKAHQFNNRMHRRILVVDGRVGFTGGFGVADEWIGDAEGPEHWRDTHLRIEGPAVRDVLGAFMENWNEATHCFLSGPHLPELAPFDDGVDVQVARSSPGHGAATAETVMLAAMCGVRQRLWITTAYFGPRRAVIDALVATAERGVDVRLLVNGSHIDKELARRVGQRSYATLLAGGVRVFEYEQTMMHAKVVVVDDGWANVGTSNWDNRSMSLQEELNCAIVDAGIVATLEKHFLTDFDGSEEIELARWRDRPVASRAYEWVGEALRHSL
ncbi:MAG: cardiolipin synthase B, partial [Acidimicrobiia bacterium]|nr:cardiolipin synthase B [Acidimicrobiia bacterium]